MFAKKVFQGIHNARGQAILIVVLVMVVALTVGLSVATRTITNLRNSQDQASSQKALSAAEAGVEQSIKNQASIASSSNPVDFSNNASYSTTVTAVSGLQFLLSGGNQLSKDEGGLLWLDVVPWSNAWAPGGSTITFYWGDFANGCSDAALEIAIVSGNSASTATVHRYALDPCSTRGNQFQTPTSGANTISGKTFYFRYQVPVTKGYLVKVLPLYTNSYVGVVAPIALPKQGNVITSTGTSDTSTRIVNVYAGYPEIPTEIFPFSLFSP